MLLVTSGSQWLGSLAPAPRVLADGGAGGRRRSGGVAWLGWRGEQVLHGARARRLTERADQRLQDRLAPAERGRPVSWRGPGWLRARARLLQRHGAGGQRVARARGRVHRLLGLLLLGALPELGAPVLEPHLDSRRVQARLLRQLLAPVHVGVVRSVEGRLELADLALAERGAVALGAHRLHQEAARRLGARGAMLVLNLLLVLGLLAVGHWSPAGSLVIGYWRGSLIAAAGPVG